MEDSHSMSPWFGSIYIFIILAPVLALAVIYGGTKLMTYLEKRESEKPKGRSENSEDRLSEIRFRRTREFCSR